MTPGHPWTTRLQSDQTFEAEARMLRNYWSYYLPIVFALFAVPETIALATRHPENTLSDYVWRTFDVIRHQPLSQWSFQHFAFAGIFTLTAVWLIGHFTLGIWR